MQVEDKDGNRDVWWTPMPEMYGKVDSRLNQSSVSSVMTKKRYEKLSQYFQLADNSAMPAPNTPGYDPLYKVRPLLETCERTFRIHYVPNKELSVDEAMVGFKGRLSWLQYMPAKPTK